MVSHTIQFILYFVISNVLAVGTVIPMLDEAPTFYAAGVRLSEGFSIIILANWLVSVAVVLGKGLQRLLFGELRLIEIERIYERSRFAIINSLIALTMFSNDFLLIPGILTLFSLFMKVFHWILKDRFEFIFQNATTPRQVLLTRNTLTLFLLLYVDFNLVYSCVEYSFGRNPDVYFAFGFEFAILFLDLLSQGGKVLLNSWELLYLNSHPDEDSMEDKGFYMKLLEITHTTLILCIHLFLLFTFIGPYRFPIYLFKDIFFNTISLVNKIREFRRYRRASKELDSKLEDAVESDLNEDNNLCIICREDMTTIGLTKGERLYPKKLQCGHIIHIGCLKGWFARSQVCPMCRAPVFGANTNRQAQQPQAQANENPQQPEQPQAEPQQDVNNHQIPQTHTPTRSYPLNSQSTATTHNHQSSILRRTAHPRSTDPDCLVVTSNSLIPPDWTLLKLSNGSLNGNQYDLRLNNSDIAKIEKVSRQPTIDPIRQSSTSPNSNPDFE